MRISKKFLFVSMLLLSSTAAHCMFDDSDKLILVHGSKVMSENNKKIAGAQSHLKDGNSFVEDEGTNIRKRLTYHNCFNGMIPEKSIGKQVSAGIATTTDLSADKNMCAYLDPLSAFQGEIFGGEPDDFMIIDGHTYGKSSIIIVPNQREEEFHEKNPHYEGKLVVFDTSINSLREKVDEIMRGLPSAPSFAEINDKKNLDDYVKFCKNHNYSHKYHAATPFMLLEETLKEFHTTISFINRKCNSTPLLPADQVEPLSIIIETTLDHIQKKLSSRLSEEKNKAIELWIIDTKNWLDLFKRDAHLRLNESKSFFRNPLAPEEIQKIIAQRKNRAFLEEVAENLFSIESVTNEYSRYPMPSTFYLGTDKSGTQFPENSIEKIFRLPLPRVQQLRDILIEKGYGAHADEISLIYFMKHFESNDESKKLTILKNGEDLFLSLLNSLTPSEQLNKRLEDWAWRVLSQDSSYRNHSAISLFNSSAGKALRHKIWGDDSTLDFWALLKANPQTAILFKDLESIPSTKNLPLGYKPFLQIVRQWLLERAMNNAVSIPECMALAPLPFQPETMTAELKDPHCSLFNFNYASTLASNMSLYMARLSDNLGDPNSPIQALIDQGCFKSWGDVIVQLYDTDGLDEEGFSEILNVYKKQSGALGMRLTVPLLGLKIESYLQNQEDDLKRFGAFKPTYEEIAQQIATAGERPINLDSLWGGGGSGWYIDTLLNQCIYGYTDEIGKNKVTILPNWEQAKILYKRLYELADFDERVKLDAMMETIFLTQ